MARYFCTGCRTEMDDDFLRADARGYLWCEACKAALWAPAQAATRAAVRPASARKPRKAQ